MGQFKLVNFVMPLIKVGGTPAYRPSGRSRVIIAYSQQ